MPALEDTAALAAAPQFASTFEGLFCCVLLGLVTDIAMQVGVDPDGSQTSARALAILGHFDQVSRGVTAPPAPWTPDAAASRKRLRAALRQMEPMLSRLVLAKAAMARDATAPDAMAPDAMARDAMAGDAMA